MSIIRDYSKEAYEILLDKILKGELAAGQKLREDYLVKMLNMSRTPIRTALAELNRDGLIDIVPYKYACIAKFDEEYITKIGIVRVGLDVMSARLALYYGSNADFDRLLKLCDLQENAVAKLEYNESRKIDCEFHIEISNISKNEILIEMQKSLYLKVRYILTYHNIDNSDKYSSVKMHRKIVSSLISRDLEATVKNVKAHLYDFYKFNDKDNIFS